MWEDQTASHQEGTAVKTAWRPAALVGSPCSSAVGPSLCGAGGEEHVIAGMSAKPEKEQSILGLQMELSDTALA
jgi:hypothetical protein